MLKKLLEKRIGQTLTGEEFAYICIMATDDIKFNRIGFKKRTSLDCALDIVEISANVHRKRGINMLDIDIDVEKESEKLCNLITQMVATNKKKRTDEANDFTFKAVQRCMRGRYAR